MTPETTKKPKRYTVLLANEEVLNTSNFEASQNKIAELQKENHPLITFVDSKQETATSFTKTIHEKNYRVKAGVYPVVVKAVQVNSSE